MVWSSQAEVHTKDNVSTEFVALAMLQSMRNPVTPYSYSSIAFCCVRARSVCATPITPSPWLSVEASSTNGSSEMQPITTPSVLQLKLVVLLNRYSWTFQISSFVILCGNRCGSFIMFRALPDLATSEDGLWKLPSHHASMPHIRISRSIP